MATLSQRTEAVEERVDSLETILARFMAHTDESISRTNESVARTEESIARLERIVEGQAQEAARHREEAARDREEAARAREIVARDRERDREEATRAREIAVRDRERDREEAARERREMNKRWGELANKMGTVVEDIVAPSIRRTGARGVRLRRSGALHDAPDRDAERRPLPDAGVRRALRRDPGGAAERDQVVASLRGCAGVRGVSAEPRICAVLS